MRLITLLNHCEHFSGFVYDKARLCQHSRTIEIEMRPRRCSKNACRRWLEGQAVWAYAALHQRTQVPPAAAGAPAPIVSPVIAAWQPRDCHPRPNLTEQGCLKRGRCHHPPRPRTQLSVASPLRLVPCCPKCARSIYRVKTTNAPPAPAWKRSVCVCCSPTNDSLA